jgi:putative transposase
MRGIEKASEVARAIMETIKPRKCKYCGSSNVVRFGHSKKSQRLRCKDCGRTFLDNEALPEMKTPVNQIAGALSMYYGGMSLNAIRRHLDQQYGNRPSDSTIYEWITRFTKEVVSKTKEYKPDVGDVWIADETVLKIGGKNVWFWDIIDAKTRFLLASHLSHTRTTKDALTLMKRAEARAGKAPELVFTDKLKAYLDGIELAWGFEAPMNTNLIERFHGSLKDRTKVLRGFKRLDTARLIMDGWLVHYNFFRPHETLKDRTPAEKAGVKYPYNNWDDVIREHQPISKPTAEHQPIGGEKLPHIQISERKRVRITPPVPPISPKRVRLP